jgi:hypothetical protein
MAGETGWRNRLYSGDNLVILREHLGDERVDLDDGETGRVPGGGRA